MTPKRLRRGKTVEHPSLPVKQEEASESRFQFTKSTKLRLWRLFSTFILFLSALSLYLATSTSKSTRFIRLTPPPLWTFSGTWTQDRTLLLVDIVSESLLEYDARTGVLLRKFSFRERPTRIHAVGRNYMLEHVDGSFSLLDPQLKLISTIHPAPQKKLFIFDWAMPNTHTIFAFGDLMVEKRRWESAFLRMPLRYPNDLDVLKTVSIENQTRKFYRLGSQYIAASHDRAFFVLMTDAPKIFVVDSGQRTPHELLAGPILGNPPLLPEIMSPDSVKQVYTALEQSNNFLAGIFAWDDYLYLLKRVRVADKPPWWLLKVDPSSGKVVSSLHLRLSDPHLTVIPGEKDWAFIEKGPVTGQGQQPVYGVTLIPTQRIEG
jgi:hypothetical protein